jgi:pyrroloquinoline quinone (PQQ) biosynthesis protein C
MHEKTICLPSDRIPTYWECVINGLDVEDPRAETIIEEEHQHAELWEQWRVDLPEASDPPELTALFDALDGMSPSELMGALHAYETQQPAVAETKKKGLVEHYGFSADELLFFDEHIEGEDEHISFGTEIRENHADTTAFTRGFRRGADRIYHSLDAFASS